MPGHPDRPAVGLDGVVSTFTVVVTSESDRPIIDQP